VVAAGGWTVTFITVTFITGEYIQATQFIASAPVFGC
jgi:hypothetical protein